jgi:hypothetical protein
MKGNIMPDEQTKITASELARLRKAGVFLKAVLSIMEEQQDEMLHHFSDTNEPPALLRLILRRMESEQKRHYHNMIAF